jgi:hypothetical protein
MPPSKRETHQHSTTNPTGGFNMAKKVIGVYDTEVEVMDIVRKLELAGYQPEDITLVAKNTDDATWIRDDMNLDTTTTADIESEDNAYQADDSFWQKVKNLFTSESEHYGKEEGFKNKFHEYGFSSIEAENYYEEIERGRMIVMVPETYAGSMNATRNVESADMHADLNNKPLFTREHDLAFLEDDDEDTLKRREKREWDIKNNEDRFKW